jgi:hypothetical protein
MYALYLYRIKYILKKICFKLLDLLENIDLLTIY